MWLHPVFSSMLTSLTILIYYAKIFAKQCCCRLKRLQYTLNLFLHQPTSSVLLTYFERMNHLTKLSLEIFYPDSSFSARHVLGTYTKQTYLKTIISILISVEGLCIAWLSLIALPSSTSWTSEEDFKGPKSLRACQVYRVSITDVMVLPAIEWQLVTMEITINLLIWKLWESLQEFDRACSTLYRSEGIAYISWQINWCRCRL